MHKWLVGIYIGCLVVTGADSATQGADSLIDLKNRSQLEQRRPVLIAHRGGVVGVNSPECSLAAIRLAAEAGYDMVELDVQKSRDETPIVFHDSTLEEACGVEGRIADYAVVDLLKVHYTGSNQRIVRLDTALALCRELHLGVMLDLKAGREDRPFLQKIDKMIVDHGLAKATVSISGTTEAREELQHVMFTPDSDQMAQFRKGEKVDLRGRFWFGLPQRLPSTDVSPLKERGALVFPAINTFRYPSDQHMDLAREDIDRLMSAGVDGFQIDSIYSELLRRE
jgi:glycerophosphoryl diester phosphodiesterase